MSREKKFNTKYSPEFKIAVIIDMRENHVSVTFASASDGDNVPQLWAMLFRQAASDRCGHGADLYICFPVFAQHLRWNPFSLNGPKEHMKSRIF